MTASEASSVSLELERLRGAVDTGFATLNGRLDVFAQRQSQVEADVTALELRHEADVTALEQRHEKDVLAIRTDLEAIKRHVWMAVGGVLVASFLLGLVTQFLTAS